MSAFGTFRTSKKPEVAADKVRETYRQSTDQFEALLKTAFPQAAREFAEKTVAQTREAYERSNKALEAAVETLEKSFDEAGQGAAALNRKIIEIAPAELKFWFRPGQELGRGQEPRRDRGAADSLFAKANRCTYGPSRGSPRVGDQSGRRYG